MNRTVWLLAAGLVAALAIPLLIGGTGLVDQLIDFPLPLFGVMLLMIFVCWFLNAAKLKVLLGEHAGRLTYPQAMGVIMATEFAYCATPGGTGGPLTLITLMARRGMRPARTTAVFTVDQLIDLSFFLISMILSVLYIAIRAVDVHLGWIMLAPITLLVVLLVSASLLGKYYRPVLLQFVRLLRKLHVKRGMRFKLIKKFLTFRNALADTLKMPRRRLLTAFFLGVMHWLVRYSVLYLALYGLGEQLNWAWTFLVQMLSMAAGQLTLLPGGAGGAELSSTALLAPIVGQSTAAAAILIWRAVTYYFYLVAGAPVFLVLAGRPLLNRILRVRQKD
ncbi:lysylphosphatidylglycerol synthase transmembrane domain-containing protein [Phytohalomonas tamaricis]|uniref:lysylphosphatidylglycerol synthase transmembrane domain-containing protein n=1 Tax=Phytohalomonas tamaricis TaxID=2081032 RepID=UPI000D0B3FFD|nr:lysylphosphatidylglycerol synthase transmembrane domain-containing protein [Phytohalomonas tamaricis]